MDDRSRSAPTALAGLAGLAGLSLLALTACAPAGAADAAAVPAGPAAAAQDAPAVERGARSAADPQLPTYTAAITPVGAADLPASWRPGCPVGPQQLRLVTFTHVDLAGRVATGRLVVREDVAQPVADVLGDLYAARFPIAQAQPVDVFGGSDDASMAANNTSAFNCRQVTGGTRFSEHSYGTAVDLNPVQNPYVRGTTVLPEAGRAFVQRTPAPGVVLAGDAAVRAFAERGFSWGGDWSSLKDYQHFSLSGD
ncbi:M15 family peptidase [Kineococcus sp. T13]|uniref:M15 family metallopeptidase n=1 Tax=Kineococcus vitellinus TaxID=2696565 RepID=UPI001411DE86|nr:M15 family metallopeptidase [Kineococcus vitellinus]NAZ74699.1 M15 family peptidase [Kineococcus vitellinus]